ncbi:hypothetical protein TTHERM_000142500 (macronuclear) [Tetrahymena thermophila SB210]|uniref:Uncharacterized protein n=1 Tax=Tetrahymena thermophila (strain SB210) TaxID=312017 RepID=W7XFM8_TETTS|nr:hypothetical protein TTHERM_000142500 [Tetrahymena thermophila SB210]EWS75648.1 hypothetical protein TTHERM_000142500 [Tetrahymena thermophila SB210]|eukprot:XP_012651794.1 hypothetical protein TTHERM_000142500 [Tetrahymena thermophila SB210]
MSFLNTFSQQKIKNQNLKALASNLNNQLCILEQNVLKFNSSAQNNNSAANSLEQLSCSNNTLLKDFQKQLSNPQINNTYEQKSQIFSTVFDLIGQMDDIKQQYNYLQEQQKLVISKYSISKEIFNRSNLQYKYALSYFTESEALLQIVLKFIKQKQQKCGKNVQRYSI